MDPELWWDGSGQTGKYYKGPQNRKMFPQTEDQQLLACSLHKQGSLAVFWEVLHDTPEEYQEQIEIQLSA